MESFKYYKRGKGELDTSNFPVITASRFLEVETLDEKTYMSLAALQGYLVSIGSLYPVKVVVKGYVAHMRGDKDFYPVANLYDNLTRLYFEVQSIQHESNESIISGTVRLSEIAYDLSISGTFSYYVGADKSVPKFCPQIKFTASKIRKEGKVISLLFDTGPLRQGYPIIIVDDILGAGATVQELVNAIRKDGFHNPISLWVRYNEGIHAENFLNQFHSFYLGDEI